MKILFSKYLNAVCSPIEFQEIIAWLVDNVNNEAITEAMKEEWEEFMHMEPDPIINRSELWAKIRLAISRKENALIKRQLGFFRWGFAAAAVMAVILFAANLFFTEKLMLPDKITHQQTVTVPNGARTSFTLPDGSQVWLNSGSTLNFASDFSTKRVLSMEGEAYFEVVKGNIPFIIKTALGQVEVTGTCLNVRNCTSEKQFETTVEQGSVNVYCPQIQDIYRLEPGQQVRYNDGKWEMLKVKTDIYTSWKDGKIIFRKEYLPTVVQRLERWYNVKIELDDDLRLKTIHYTGTLKMESFSEVMELLKITAPIKYTYNDKTRVIRISHL